MNCSTAQNRLVKDLLYYYAVESQQVSCYHCKKPMTRENFSIEHIDPWLDSDDPIGNFFDLQNISFSHLSCNIKASRIPHKQDLTEDERKDKSNKATKEWWNRLGKKKQQDRRRKNYAKYGC